LLQILNTAPSLPLCLWTTNRLNWYERKHRVRSACKSLEQSPTSTSHVSVFAYIGIDALHREILTFVAEISRRHPNGNFGILPPRLHRIVTCTSTTIRTSLIHDWSFADGIVFIDLWAPRVHRHTVRRITLCECSPVLLDFYTCATPCLVSFA
jgi:hypothetical protein